VPGRLGSVADQWGLKRPLPADRLRTPKDMHETPHGPVDVHHHGGVIGLTSEGGARAEARNPWEGVRGVLQGRLVVSPMHSSLKASEVRCSLDATLSS
jgi:hypothetical protein